jgi:hypothetical protein
MGPAGDGEAGSAEAGGAASAGDRGGAARGTSPARDDYTSGVAPRAMGSLGATRWGRATDRVQGAKLGRERRMLRPTEMMGWRAVFLQLDRARELTGTEGA